LNGIDQFDVSNGAGRLLNLARHAFIAFGAKAGRPFHRRAAPDFFLPFRAHAAKVIDKDIVVPLASARCTTRMSAFGKPRRD